MQKLKERKALIFQTKDSSVFSEAHLILKESVGEEVGESEMVLEANRIIAGFENQGAHPFFKREKKRRSSLFYFFSGMMSAFLFLLCWSLIFIFLL